MMWGLPSSALTSALRGPRRVRTSPWRWSLRSSLQCWASWRVPDIACKGSTLTRSCTRDICLNVHVLCKNLFGFIQIKVTNLIWRENNKSYTIRYSVRTIVGYVSSLIQMYIHRIFEVELNRVPEHMEPCQANNTHLFPALSWSITNCMLILHFFTPHPPHNKS